MQQKVVIFTKEGTPGRTMLFVVGDKFNNVQQLIIDSFKKAGYTVEIKDREQTCEDYFFVVDETLWDTHPIE